MKLILTILSVLKWADGLLPFPQGTATGFLAALAIPIEVPGRNVYASINLEINYVLPTKATDFTEGFYEKVLLVDGVDEQKEKESTSNFEARKLNALSYVTRLQVYEMIERKMETYGLNGRSCLMRIICEASRSNLIETNGVFGNIAHVIFSPSSSQTENGLSEYLDAENSPGNCIKYSRKCSVSFLNAISVLMK